jgi:hypothetical protein
MSEAPPSPYGPKFRACATSRPSTPSFGLLGAVRRSIREHGGEPSSRQVDELLDERLVHLRGDIEDVAVDT